MLQRFIVKMPQAAAIAVAAFAFSSSALAHQADAGKKCVQYDCDTDIMVNTCAFPVQTIHGCEKSEDGASLCSTIGAFNTGFVGHGESRVQVIGAIGDFSDWDWDILSPNESKKNDRVKTGNDGDAVAHSREAVVGYGCAVPDDGSVHSAGGQWRTGSRGQPALACIHTHESGGREHRHRSIRPHFQCPGEFVNNWAASCLQYKSNDELGTFLVNTCKCPVVVDACHGKHPCDESARIKTNLAPGEDIQIAPLAESEAEWAACFLDDEPYTEDIKNADGNLWTCAEIKTACSAIETVNDPAKVVTRFQAHNRETAQQQAEQPEQSQDPLAALRGTPPPTGTKTEEWLRKMKYWDGQLDPQAILEQYSNASHLYITTLENDLKAAQWLVANGADVNAKADKNITPLQLVAYWNSTEIAALLLENGADVNLKNSNGWTPLYQAARGNSFETAKLLLENGADVNAKAEDGAVPLHEAAGRKTTETAALLLENGAEVNAKDKYGGTPLDWALYDKRPEMLSLLHAHGGKCNKRC